MRANPTVSGGNANKINAEATNVVHVNKGSLIYVMPGALMLIIVAKKVNPGYQRPEPRYLESEDEKVYAVPFRMKRK